MSEQASASSEDQTRQQVLDTIADVAVELLGVERDVVTADARFDEDLDVDSLGLVEFVMAVEDKFDVKVPEEKLEGITTVGQAADLVIELGGQSRPEGEGPEAGVREPRRPEPGAGSAAAEANPEEAVA